MLQNLKDLTASAPPIRIGGTTANHGFYVADQKEAIIRNFATPGADQPANVSWGPAYLESFKVFPEGTKYTVGVTFDSGKDGEDMSVEEAKAFYGGIGEDLYAIEVGNEFDGAYLSTRYLESKLTVSCNSFPSRSWQRDCVQNRAIRPRVAQSHGGNCKSCPQRCSKKDLPSWCFQASSGHKRSH
jgi:hypothetical protein